MLIVNKFDGPIHNRASIQLLAESETEGLDIIGRRRLSITLWLPSLNYSEANDVDQFPHNRLQRTGTKCYSTIRNTGVTYERPKPNCLQGPFSRTDRLVWAYLKIPG